MNLSIIFAIVLIAFLFAIFFISYVFNKKTPIPEECRDLFEEKKCEGCKQYDCAFHKELEEIKEVKEEEK